MSLQDVIRAWKDEDFRLSLSAAELAQLPANPAGLIELEDADLEAAAGGRPYITNSNGTCTMADEICCSYGPW